MNIRVRKRVCMLMAGVSMALSSPAAWAAPQGREISFNVPAGTLDNALIQIASQSGHRIIFDPAVVRGRTVNGLQGAMTPEQAVQQLLGGTGLTLRIDEKGQWLVVRSARPAPLAEGAEGKILGTVRVTTGAERLGNVGANGSSDILATEGTKSYTTNAQAITSKQPLTLKETPQAVSVLTRQQLDDRSINSFNSALDALPGVTVSAFQASGLTSGIYSRGFEITNVQIDGGSPINVGATNNFTSNHSIVDDLSAYDSVEVERGAAGQFTGVGAPGGVLSLVRKRPLDHAALDGIVQAGSWNRFRGVLDASSPVWLDGLVRARVVLTAENNDEFYNYAKRRFWQAYANIEIDPSPTTTINFGTKITRNRSTPFNGLPTDATGALIDFPRETCYCTDWGKAVVNGKEFFVQLTQKAGKDWTFHLNGSANLQKTNSHYFVYIANNGGLNVSAPFSATENIYNAQRRSDQYLIDGYVNGKTRFAGVGIDLTLGANYQKINQAVAGFESFYYYTNPVADLLPFDATKFADRPDSAFLPGIQTNPVNKQEQYGVYGTLRVSPVDWLHFTIGERYTHYSFATVRQTYSSNGSSSSTNNNTQFNIFSPPNLGLVVDVSKTVSAFASYASIFDRNNLYTKDGNLVEPTTGLNAEAGLKGALYGGKLNVAGSLFYIRQINLPQLDASVTPTSNSNDGSSCCYFSDGSKYRSKGFDFQLQGALTSRLNVDLSYVYTDFKYVAGSLNQARTQQLTQPAHLAKIWASWQPPVADDRLMLGAGIHGETSIYASKTEVVFSGGRLSNRTYMTSRPGYVTADAMIKYSLYQKLSVQLNLTNIFDRTYYRTIRTSYGNYYGSPRAFLITLHGSL